MTKLFAIMGLMTISIAYARAQRATVTVEGIVVNAQQVPIEFATVLLQHASDSTTADGTITNTAGIYWFKNIQPGAYFVKAQFLGYATRVANITVGDSAIHHVESIELYEDSKLLAAAVVQGQKPLLEQDGEKLVFHVQHSITAMGASAIEVLERAPGVSIGQNDQISLHGKTGTVLLIDGKTVNLPPTELAAMLRGMNANNIESVEIQVNPSARYDAAGNAGVINIRMKKNTWDGFHGFITTGAGYGRYGKGNATANLNYRGGKWTHFLNYGYNINRRYADMMIDRSSAYHSGIIYFRQQSNRVQRHGTHAWQAVSEWQLNTHNTFTLGLSGNYNDRKTVALTTTDMRSEMANASDSSLVVTNDQLYRWNNATASLGFKHVFTNPGREIAADFDYSEYRFDLADNISVSAFEGQHVPKNYYAVLSQQPSSFNIYAGRIDYLYPLKPGVSLEVGTKYSSVSTRNDISYVNNASGEFQTDTFRSNDFRYTERIVAAYVNMKAQIGGFNSQFGIRAERTRYQGTTEKENRTIQRDYLRIFPNVSIGRDFSEQYHATLSYSYRIDRPAYNDLYPFIYFLDPFSGQKGNPLLLPQFTHSFQFSQTIAKNYTINAGQSFTKNYMAFVIELEDDRVSGYATRRNFDRYFHSYINLIAPIQISNRWAVNANVNIFYSRVDSEGALEYFKTERFSGAFNLLHTIQLPWEVTGEIGMIYNAPAVFGPFQNRALGSVNAGLQKSFLDKKLTVRFNMADIFQTNRLKNRLLYSGLDLSMDNRLETRIARINLTYAFGKESVKNMRRRNAQDDEQRRISTN